MSRYELRVLLGSWGLMVDLDLSVHDAAEMPAGGVPVAPGAWLVKGDSVELWEGDLPHLLNGLRRVVPRFQERQPSELRELVFVLDHFWYPLTDSQDDAIELAVAGWATEELGIDTQPADVTFDRAANAYSIEFNEDIWRTGGCCTSR